MSGISRIANQRLKRAMPNTQEVYNMGIRELHLAVSNKDWGMVKKLTVKLEYLDKVMAAAELVLAAPNTIH